MKYIHTAKQQCHQIEVLNDSALSSNLDWCDVSAEDAEWTMILQIIKGHLNEMNCAIFEQLIEARQRKKTGERAKYATTVVEERRRMLQEKEDKQQHDLEKCIDMRS